MATGDTIKGTVTVYKIETDGSRMRVAGPFPVTNVNTFGSNPQDKVFVNVGLSGIASKPPLAQSKTFPAAEFVTGEVLEIEHSAYDDSGAREIDVSADTFNVETSEVNQQRGNRSHGVLNAERNEVTTDKSTDADGSVIYRETIPDNQHLYLAGVFELDAVEV